MRLLTTLMIWAFAVSHAAAQPVRPPQPDEPRVKTSTRELAGGNSVRAVVAKVDADKLTVVLVHELTGELTTREAEYVPNDVLRSGKYMEEASNRFTYLWEDVKAGDTVDLETNKDRVDGVNYCLEISIMKRPKGRLPVCQKKEYKFFEHFRLMNDIDNGEDVSDEEIAKVFVYRPAKKIEDVTLPAVPAGLNKEYQGKLDAIRAKKAKAKDEPKAKPPEKPADKK